MMCHENNGYKKPHKAVLLRDSVDFQRMTKYMEYLYNMISLTRVEYIEHYRHKTVEPTCIQEYMEQNTDQRKSHFRKTEILGSMCSDHNGMKSEINKNHISRKVPHI